MFVASAPADWMDVGCRLITPVVIGLGPAIEVDQELVTFDLGNGGHTDKALVHSVLGFQLHPYFKHAACFMRHFKLSLRRCNTKKT